jgi:adenine-specific DNA-methyltransferase
MARAKKGSASAGGGSKRKIEQYDHRKAQRKNNPPVGLVTEATDRDTARKQYQYDPHLDPARNWAGKAEHTSFEVPTVSLHVHERIDPKTIIEAVRRRNGTPTMMQGSLFESAEENPPLREAIDFYQHAHAWSNRLIAGDSLLVMNSLLEKEGLGGKVQMIYIDPPYGIRYGSNFQPFVNKRDVKDGSDDDLTQEPEMIRAFRDTWELGVHSYLTYLRDRLLLAKDLLHESGSCFVQISDENVHHVRELMDEVFGPGQFQAQINFTSTSALGQKGLAKTYDYIVWYARDSDRTKFRPLFKQRDLPNDREWRFIDDPKSPLGFRRLTDEEFSRLKDYEGIFRRSKLTSSGFTPTCIYNVQCQGRTCRPFGGKSWVTTREGMEHLISIGRIFMLGDNPYFKQYLRDFPVVKYDNSWQDQPAPEARRYVVETATKFVERCLLMATDPGDLVFDPTCGSGTTAFVAEQWGRRWITCDTSRVAVTLAKQRIMAAAFEYYELASIANNEPAGQETLYDAPLEDVDRVRVTGPFTVEAVPAPTVRPMTDSSDAQPADASVARSGETLRQAEWRSELLKTGIRGKNNQMIMFSRVEPLAGTRWLHADAESMPNTRGSDRVSEPKPGAARSAERVVVSFGSQYAPLEQRQVELAWEEARTLSPKPSILVFAAFQFDPEAAKDIDELTREKTGMTFVKVQMNPDLLTEDLKKKRASNESFWLMGQPDVDARVIAKGEHKGKIQVEVHGFDYYNTKTGAIESGDTKRIAMWMLAHDYDGRSLFPRQVFFPLADDAGGWARLARNLRAEIDEERIEAYRGTVSLPFEPGAHKRVAVKIVDDRGIESLKIVPLK